VAYRTGFGLDEWIYCTLYIHNSGLQIIQRSRYSTHFAVHRSTRTRIPAFTSRILATELQQSHCHFKSHMKSSLQCKYFLTIILQLPIPKTRRNLVIPSSYPGSGVSTLDCSLPSPLFYPVEPLRADTTENTASVGKEVCLLMRCLTKTSYS
jgi:hypothetical protein